MARFTGSRTGNPEGRMALTEHLRELRRRFILAAIGIALGMVAGWILFPTVFEELQRPIELLNIERPEIATLNFDNLGGAFDMRIRIALFTGALLTSPWWIYQLFAFITPGLTKQERRYTYGFMAVAVPLFAAGAYLAWSALPNAVGILLGDFTPDGATNILTADTYLRFVMQFVLAFGIAFLVPLIMVVLNFLGMVSAGLWLRSWRWAIIGIFTFAAFATPTPDAISMILMALPMVLLYFIAVLVCHLHDRRVAKRRAAEDAALGIEPSSEVDAGPGSGEADEVASGTRPA